jgi:DNA-binding NarL/FixJ family response regulator
MAKENIRFLELASLGWSYEAIGKELGVQVDALYSRACKLFQILGADNITHAVAIALRKKLIT